MTDEAVLDDGHYSYKILEGHSLLFKQFKAQLTHLQ